MSMRKIRVEKITLNIGAGKDPKKLEKGITLLKYVTGIDPVKCVTMKRIQGWGLRPGLPIGAKITLRGETSTKLLKRLFGAKDYIIKESAFDNVGNVSFGIPEYIDIPDIKYDPTLGIAGFEVAVTVSRPGYRVKQRSRKNKIGNKHRITKEESIAFFKKEYNINTGEAQ